MAHSVGTAHHFVVCIRNDDYPASLEPRKIYECLPDRDAGKHGQLRIVDESGDHYLYPKHYFVSIELPEAAEEAVVNKA